MRPRFGRLIGFGALAFLGYQLFKYLTKEEDKTSDSKKENRKT